jgi:hypothetical protein
MLLLKKVTSKLLLKKVTSKQGSRLQQRIYILYSNSYLQAGALF